MAPKPDKEGLNIERQIHLLESLDSTICENARHSLEMLVRNGKGIPNLINYFCSTRSERIMEILYKVDDGNHNILLDTLKNLMKEKKLPEVLTLLGQIIMRQPSWVNQVVKHSLFKSIIEHLKTTKPIIIRDVISGMFFMAMLLPLCSDTPQTALLGFFYFFLHGCETLALLIAAEKEEKIGKKEKSIRERMIKEEVEPEHYAVALREYFQALYGIFPIHFTTFLRDYFDRQDKRKPAVMNVIQSLLNGVRLHPHLIFHTKEWEQSGLRYEKTDAAFFQDQIRQMTIGVIPVPVNFDNNDDSEQESPSFDGASSKDHTFTYPPFDSESTSSSVWMEETAGLLDNINTPETSRPGSPTRKNQSEVTSPIVLPADTRTRFLSGESQTRTTRLGSISSSFSNMWKRAERRSVAAPENTLIEIERGNEVRRRDSKSDSDNLYDEAEDALDDLPSIDHKVIQDKKYSNSTSNETHRLMPVEDITDDERKRTTNLLEAAKAARKAVRERSKIMETETDTPIRSRSASLKPVTGGQIQERGRTTTMDAGLINKTPNSEETTSSESADVRSRFSVTSYFKKLNRQRFVSECPQRLEDPIAEKVALSPRTITLERTFSCPDLIPSKFTSNVPTKLNLQKRNYALPGPLKSDNFYESFPYFKKYQPLDFGYFHNLEERFAAKQEKKLNLYMGASKVYHSCLKDLGLADRLPGRIYDDLSHITEGLPIEKQRDLLRARLQLVNQHLMYERSCRMLHALRNRRLFVQITGENALKVQLISQRAENHKMREELDSLIAGLTAKRKEFIESTKKHNQRETELTARYVEMRQDQFRHEHEISGNWRKLEEMQKKEKEARAALETQQRRAEDAEETIKSQRNEMEMLMERGEELKRANEENQQLKDHLKIMEVNADRLRSPELEERLRSILSVELDRVTKERENERQIKEELREKNNELEHCWKLEQIRSEQFKHELNRAARILEDQKEAAEQKFLTLQLINEKHLEMINNLYVELETARDAEAAFKAKIKTNNLEEVPPEPEPDLLGTSSYSPTITFCPQANRPIEESIFQMEDFEDTTSNMDL